MICHLGFLWSPFISVTKVQAVSQLSPFHQKVSCRYQGHNLRLKGLDQQQVSVCMAGKWCCLFLPPRKCKGKTRELEKHNLVHSNVGCFAEVWFFICSFSAAPSPSGQPVPGLWHPAVLPEGQGSLTAPIFALCLLDACVVLTPHQEWCQKGKGDEICRACSYRLESDCTFEEQFEKWLVFPTMYLDGNFLTICSIVSWFLFPSYFLLLLQDVVLLDECFQPPRPFHPSPVPVAVSLEGPQAAPALGDNISWWAVWPTPQTREPRADSWASQWAVIGMCRLSWHGAAQGHVLLVVSSASAAKPTGFLQAARWLQCPCGVWNPILLSEKKCWKYHYTGLLILSATSPLGHFILHLFTIKRLVAIREENQNIEPGKLFYIYICTYPSIAFSPIEISTWMVYDLSAGL